MIVDAAALDDWNAAQERAKAAYDEAPAACADLFSKTCHRCREDSHTLCTGRATEGGRAACRCWTAGHRTNHPSTRRTA